MHTHVSFSFPGYYAKGFSCHVTDEKRETMTAANVLKITETRPTPIVRDFDTYVNCIRQINPPLLRKGHFLSRKTLYEIDQLMSHPDPENTPETPKIFYPHLSLFYEISLGGNLFIKTKTLHLEETERLAAYTELNATEKYFFLLETLWVDTNWAKLPKEFIFQLSIPRIQSIMEYFARIPKEKAVTIMGTSIWDNPLTMHNLLLYLSFLGLLRITFDKEGVKFFKDRKFYRVASARKTDFGNILIPILSEKRNLLRWNIPYLQERRSRFLRFPPSAKHKKEHELFITSFQQIFKDLQRTVPRKEYVRGTFVLRVSIDRNCWRTIAISSEHTLEDLHEAIQDAFEFDKDHPYAFFMDGIPWSPDRIMAPGCDEGPSADHASIGDLGLVTGQQFLYLFDFHDEWRFKVEVVKIGSETGPPQPLMTEKKGKSPEQYWSYVEDDYDEES